MKPIGVLTNSTKRVDAFRLIECCFSASCFFVCIGLAGVLFALAKLLAANPGATLIAAAAGSLCSALVIWLGLKISSQRLFVAYLSAFWLVSRGFMIMLFPRYVLAGDEAFFHNFVSKLVNALPSGTVASLSNIYDYPVWISRAFPFYLPLSFLFGPNDLLAARWMNVCLGAAQLISLFFVAKMLADERIARVTCLLFLVFPYHWLNVLSYDPQEAGTFFLLTAVLLFLLLMRRLDSSNWLLAIGLGLSLFLAGIQRGGIDILFVAVMLVSVFLLRPNRHSLLALGISIALIWLPARVAFTRWIDSYDAYHLRTHALGFMTRGWNLETSGEYLPLYEQLDVVSPKAEKNRLLESVLVTEFARQPLRSLLVLPVVKIAKLLAIGYASTAEVGLERGGYLEALNLYRVLRSVYAPVILAFCAYGLLCSIGNTRLVLPVLLITLSCLGIVLLWETSPRYSHPFQFAIVLVAAAGIELVRQKEFALQRLALEGCIFACLWLSVGAVTVWVCRFWTRCQLIDPRQLEVRLGATTAQLSPVQPFTQSWEDGINVPAGTSLPATLDLKLPENAVLHVWQLNGRDYQIENVPSAESGHIARLVLNRDRPSTLVVSAKDGSNVVRSSFQIGVGFILSE